MMTRDKMITRLKGKISATRLTHSFGVEYTAANEMFAEEYLSTLIYK